MANILSLAILLLAIVCSSSDALTCYQCVYFEVDGFVVWDPDCGIAGETPDDYYLEDCSNPTRPALLERLSASSGFPPPHFNLSRHVAGKKKLASALAPPPLPGLTAPSVSVGCMYMYGTGVTEKDEHITYKATGCHYTSTPQFENCEAKRVASWAAGEDHWSYIVHDFSDFIGLPEDGTVDACYCTGEKCNGGGLGSGGCNNAK